ADLEASTSDEVHMRYIPGTKVVGVVSFEGPAFSPNSHGVGTTSVSVGNLHGTCAECLLVFINNPNEEALAWVTQQPWIDAITNSYGSGSFQVQGIVRDNIYSACDLGVQRSGVERGQQIFFSAGNGLLNTFDAPPQTLWSCQKGPDWTVTVGAIDPDTGASYTGHGKPVDVASVGNAYPSAGGGSVSAEDTFSGTSNAAPVAAGIYAAALHGLRELLPGPSRVQDNGTVAVGPAGCGDANPSCALLDGVVTVHEMREAFFRAAEPTSAYFQAMAPLTDIGAEVPAAGTEETELWTEGHGSFWGRLGDLDAEVGRAVAYATGEWSEETPPGLLDWMAAYSYCSQAVWGGWDHGYYVEGITALPAPDPAWPYRTWLAGPCPDTVRTVVQAGSASPFG
ncbi:MAG TPA: S8/S53 family peptidase, partial [Candidatus Thermoplasmatota archaeon]|nr:S8/S53 family peptidase [Candidatus Thermoplasmatota archaeon]